MAEVVRRTWRPWLAAALAVAAVAVASFVDQWVAHHAVYPRIYEIDLGRMLRVMGFLPLWLVAALALALCDRPAALWWRRGLMLALAPTIAGIGAEVLKIIVRRERPNDAVAGYVFRPWSDHPFAGGGLGMPSSHAMVAFGAAAILARLFPRASVVWYALAIGCGATRILSHMHFTSDVVVAAIGGIAAAQLVWRTVGAREPASA